jgi:aerotaxis receptor
VWSTEDYVFLEGKIPRTPTAAEEQSVVAEEISRNVVNVNHEADNNLVLASNVSEQSDQITKRSESLASLPLSFRE